jgi:hypothetical protein
VKNSIRRYSTSSPNKESDEDDSVIYNNNNFNIIEEPEISDVKILSNAYDTEYGSPMIP